MHLRLPFASRRVFQFRKFVYGRDSGSRTQPGLHGRLRGLLRFSAPLFLLRPGLVTDERSALLIALP